ncbi:MAG TPA: 50S ribosomal protein L24 [Acidimicrobiales bacterium]|nr:50S ribosomal protein L24 [Acidimicrobiales bacterium]
MKVHRGDHVIVLSGTNKGKRGEVVRALPEKNKVVVEGVNRMKRHQRTTQVRKRAGIIEKDLPVPVSIVALICPKEHTPTRATFRTSDDGSQRRVCGRCGEGL